MIKKISIALTAIALLAGSSAVAGSKYGWNPEKGKKLFISKVKKQICHKKLGIKKFTQAHTQKEWKDIYESGQFEAEFQKLCPDFTASTFTDAQVESLADAAINYAKDSYNIPS